MQSPVGFIFFHSEVVTGYNRTPGKHAAIIRRKTIHIITPTGGLPPASRQCHTNGCSRGLQTQRTRSLLPIHPQGNFLQRKQVPETRHTDQVQEHEHCTIPVTLVTHQSVIGIFFPRSFSPYPPGNDRNELRGIPRWKNHQAPKRKRRAG